MVRLTTDSATLSQCPYKSGKAYLISGLDNEQILHAKNLTHDTDRADVRHCPFISVSIQQSGKAYFISELDNERILNAKNLTYVTDRADVRYCRRERNIFPPQNKSTVHLSLQTQVKLCASLSADCYVGKRHSVSWLGYRSV